MLIHVFLPLALPNIEHLCYNFIRFAFHSTYVQSGTTLYEILELVNRWGGGGISQDEKPARNDRMPSTQYSPPPSFIRQLISFAIQIEIMRDGDCEVVAAAQLDFEFRNNNKFAYF